MQKQEFEKWKNVIPNGAKLKGYHLICELHFKENDIERKHVQKINDTETFDLERERFKLRTGAVPCLLLHVQKSRSSINDEKSELCFFLSILY